MWRENLASLKNKGLLEALRVQIFIRVSTMKQDISIYRTNDNKTKSVIGLYAALKGYDGIYQPDGNGSGHGFVIILSRSKIVYSID